MSELRKVTLQTAKFEELIELQNLIGKEILRRLEDCKEIEVYDEIND